MKKYAFVGDNLVGNDWKPGRRVLLDTMKERGIREDQVEYFPVNSWTKKSLLESNYKVVVAFGDRALKLFVDDAWKTEQTRGYFWEISNLIVLATMDPELVSKSWVPWRMLMSMDLDKCKKLERELPSKNQRPVHTVHIL